MDWIEIGKWVIGIAVVVLSLSYTIRHFKIVRTIHYIERFNTPTMIETRAVVEKWSKLSHEEQLQKLEEDSELFYKVNLIYNLITEIGISYKYKIINRKLTCEIFDPLVPLLNETIQPFIYLARKKDKPLGFYTQMISDTILTYRKKNTKQYKEIKLNIPEEKNNEK